MSKNKKPQSLHDLGGLIYSTDKNMAPQGWMEDSTLPPAKQDLRLWNEIRNGKKTTVIRNFIGSCDDLEALGKLLKTKCSTGGSAKEGEIILQGDVRQKVADILSKEGYKYKFAGGK